MEKKEYIELIHSLQGKTIAIVYIYEGETAAGYSHYESWKTDVISSWMFAIEELHCLPLIIDIRTFVQKAMNKSLPTIDYVINLNNGTKILSTLGLVPSVCSFLDIPCIPCNTTTIICGEHKKISNIIAEKIGINVPKELPHTDNTGITKPIGLGSSLGIMRGFNNALSKDTIYQEFINGFDITTPLLYNPFTSSLEVLPGVLYIPDNCETEWFLGEQQKKLHREYQKVTVRLSESAEEKYLHMAKELDIFSFARIDARLKCISKEELDQKIKEPILSDDLYFLEINPMPTIKDNINFHTSLNAIDEAFSIFTCYELYKKNIPNASNTGFILSCSILSAIAKH